ncbi:hypothetical protein J1N35_023355 [Gossypium stocksii]|uniref:Uncharacterized protein n=1 Tax=Gossypium stocksii TaxID=47602 RepID=A0A9D3VJD6_9ROSI|nr:hypothetical protein J1N35_023355 [Gossypium stocksii]
MSTWQKENESFCDFIKRINVFTTITKGVSNALAIQAFLVRTTHKFFLFHLIGNLPEQLFQLYKTVHRSAKGDQIDIGQVKSLTQEIQRAHFHKRCSPPHHYQALARQYQP